MGTSLGSHITFSDYVFLASFDLKTVRCFPQVFAFMNLTALAIQASHLPKCPYFGLFVLPPD